MPTGQYFLSKLEKLKKTVLEKIHNDNNKGNLYNYVRLVQLLTSAIDITEDIIDDHQDQMTIIKAEETAKETKLDMEVNKAFFLPMLLYRHQLIEKNSVVIEKDKL